MSHLIAINKWLSDHFKKILSPCLRFNYENTPKNTPKNTHLHKILKISFRFRKMYRPIGNGKSYPNLFFSH